MSTPGTSGSHADGGGAGASHEAGVALPRTRARVLASRAAAATNSGTAGTENVREEDDVTVGTAGTAIV